MKHHNLGGSSARKVAVGVAQRGATAARCRGGAGDIDTGCDVRIVATKVCVDEACILSD